MADDQGEWISWKQTQERFGLEGSEPKSAYERLTTHLKQTKGVEHKVWVAQTKAGQPGWTEAEGGAGGLRKYDHRTHKINSHTRSQKNGGMPRGARIPSRMGRKRRNRMGTSHIHGRSSHERSLERSHEKSQGRKHDRRKPPRKSKT